MNIALFKKFEKQRKMYVYSDYIILLIKIKEDM